MLSNEIKRLKMEIIKFENLEKNPEIRHLPTNHPITRWAQWHQFMGMKDYMEEAYMIYAWAITALTSIAQTQLASRRITFLALDLHMQVIFLRLL